MELQTEDRETAGDIVVIGAGPAGLTAAYQLGKHMAGMPSCWRPTRWSAGSPRTAASMTGVSTSVATASLRRSDRFGSSGTRFFPTRISCFDRG